MLEYEPVGSLAGMLRVKDRAVDFAISDMPMRPAELAEAGLVQFPIVFGGIVVAVNLDGVGDEQLRLSGPILADIFLGKISRWSDRAIAAQNPKLRLPDSPIVVIHRSEGSGTTFNFSDYLSKVSAEWSAKVGSGFILELAHRQRGQRQSGRGAAHRGNPKLDWLRRGLASGANRAWTTRSSKT